MEIASELRGHDVAWFSDPTTFQWWGEGHTCPQFEFNRVTVHSFLTSLENNRLPRPSSWQNVANIQLRFKDDVLNADTLTDGIDSIPFEVVLSWHGSPDTAQQLLTQQTCMGHIIRIMEWLETDPHIGSYRISEHRAKLRYKIVSAKLAKDHTDAVNRASDRAFTVKEAKAVVDELRQEVTKPGSSNYVSRDFMYRDGTRMEGHHTTIYVQSDSVRRKDGSWTERVTFRFGSWSGRPDPVKTLISKLQEEYSYEKTHERWAAKAKSRVD